MGGTSSNPASLDSQSGGRMKFISLQIALLFVVDSSRTRHGSRALCQMCKKIDHSTREIPIKSHCGPVQHKSDSLSKYICTPSVGLD